MKFDFVDAVAVTVERAQHRRIDVGGEAEPDGFRFAECLAECVEFVRRPAGFLAHESRTKRAVGFKQFVGFGRRRLVGDLTRGAALCCWDGWLSYPSQYRAFACFPSP